MPHTVIAVLLLAFVAGSVSCFATSRVAGTLLHAWRRYFVGRIGAGLHQSHVFADLTMLFAASLALISLLALAGFMLLGLPGMLIGTLIGALLPEQALTMIRRRRVQRFMEQLPDALHSLASTLRSGVNLPKGLEQLASWQPAPLSEELRMVLSEYQIGRDLGEALDSMHSRIDRAEIDLLIGAITISRSVGGNLADTLESLAETLSEKQTIEGKIHALTAMGRMQGWVVSAVPLLMGIAMYLTTPDQIMPLFTEVRGWITLLVIGVMMTLAVLTIRRIVNIDV